jgi:hypothetical protein
MVGSMSALLLHELGLPAEERNLIVGMRFIPELLAASKD